MDREFIIKGLDILGEKIDSIRELSFSLNDMQEELSKEYFFTFEVAQSGYVCFYLDKPYGEISLFLEDVPVVENKEFYIKKGVYQVKILANLTQNETITIRVKGYVKYYNTSTIKVLNSDLYSAIAVYDRGELSLFRYNGEISLIDKISTPSYDFYLLNNCVILYYLTPNGFVKKSYLEDFTNSEQEEFALENLSEIKCCNEQKVGLYAVIGNILHKFDNEKSEFVSLNLRVKNLLASQNDSVVFRDFDNKIKLCNFSVSPKKIN